MNFVFAWCVERLDPDKREGWEAMLTAPLPGGEKAAPTPFTAEQEGESFMAAMAAHATQRV